MDLSLSIPLEEPLLGAMASGLDIFHRNVLGVGL